MVVNDSAEEKSGRASLLGEELNFSINWESFQYDAYGKAGFKHRKELDEFSNIVNSDGIKSHYLAYQELIPRLSEFRKEHQEYIKYLTTRYLLV